MPAVTYPKPRNITQEEWDKLTESEKQSTSQWVTDPDAALKQYEAGLPQALESVGFKMPEPTATPELPGYPAEYKPPAAPKASAPKAPEITLSQDDITQLMDSGQTEVAIEGIRRLGRTTDTEFMLKEWFPEIAEPELNWVFATDEERKVAEEQANLYEDFKKTFNIVAPEHTDDEKALDEFLEKPDELLAFLKSKPSSPERNLLIRYMFSGEFQPYSSFMIDLQDDKGNPIQAWVKPNNDVAVGNEVVAHFNPDTGEFEAPKNPWYKKVFDTVLKDLALKAKMFSFIADVAKTPVATLWLDYEAILGKDNAVARGDYWATIALNKFDKEFMDSLMRGEVDFSDFANILNVTYDAWKKNLAEYGEIEAPTIRAGVEKPAIVAMFLGEGELTFGVKGLTEILYELPFWLALPTATRMITDLTPVAKAGGVFSREAASAITLLKPFQGMEWAMGTGLRYGVGLPIKGLTAADRKIWETAFDKGLVRWFTKNGMTGSTANKILNKYFSETRGGIRVGKEPGTWHVSTPDGTEIVVKLEGTDTWSVNSSVDKTIEAMTPGLEKAAGDSGIKLPKPPVPGGVAPTPAESSIAKLKAFLKQAGKARILSEPEKAAARSQKAGILASELERSKGEGIEAVARALKAQAGILPKAKFEKFTPFTKEEANAFVNEILESPAFIRTIRGREPGTWQFRDYKWERVNASTALNDMVLNGVVPTRYEVGLLRKVYGDEVAKGLLDKRLLGDKAWDAFLDLLNMPRSLLASIDLSATARQGFPLWTSHPNLVKRSFSVQVKALAKEEWAEAVEKEILTRPNAFLYEDAGLFLAPTTKEGNLLLATILEREEAFASRGLQNIKIPGIPNPFRASERAYLTFLNQFRSDIFDQTIMSWERAGFKLYDAQGKYIPEALGKATSLARVINTLSGRGELGKLERIAPLLGGLMWSPRLWAARTLFPYTAATAKGARMFMLRDLAAGFTVGVSLLTIAKVSGADVELDPRSSDFGKIKIGDTRLDIWGGFQQPMRYLAQFILNQGKSVHTGDVYSLEDLGGIPGRAGVMLKYAESKLNPAIGLMWGLMKGESYLGEEYKLDKSTALDILKNNTVPLFIQDLLDALETEGWIGLLKASPAGLGWGATTYPKSDWAFMIEKRAELSDGKWDNPDFTIDDKQAIYQSPEGKDLIDLELTAKWTFSSDEYGDRDSPEEIWGDKYKSIWEKYVTATLQYGAGSREAKDIRLEAPIEFQDAGVAGLGWKDYFPADTVYRTQKDQIVKWDAEYFALPVGAKRTAFKEAHALYWDWRSEIVGDLKARGETATTGTTATPTPTPTPTPTKRTPYDIAKEALTGGTPIQAEPEPKPVFAQKMLPEDVLEAKYQQGQNPEIAKVLTMPKMTLGEFEKVYEPKVWQESLEDSYAQYLKNVEVGAGSPQAGTYPSSTKEAQEIAIRQIEDLPASMLPDQLPNKMSRIKVLVSAMIGIVQKILPKPITSKISSTTTGAVTNFLNKSKINNLGYDVNQYNCLNFAIQLSQEAEEQGLDIRPAYLIGASHVINWFEDQEGNIRYIEAQSDGIMTEEEVKDKWKSPTIVRM